jgi:glycosyltransferase involved in cell wall biosynthesis
MTHDLASDSLPLVDIVIPVFNADRHISATLNTINDQDYPNINVYAVDDCSTDHSSEILANHNSKYPFFIVRHERNRGLSAARNTGISKGHGRFIAILDADDLWATDKISKQVSAFLDGSDSLGVISTYFRVIDRDGNMASNTIYDYCKDIEPCTRQLLVGGNLVSGGSAAMIRRDCFVKCGGFDESLTACEDWEMWYRISCNYSIKILPDPLVLVRRYPESMQGDTPRMLRNRLEVLRRFMPDQQCASFARTLYRNECVRCFRYLSLNPKTSATNAVNRLNSLGICPDKSEHKLWAAAYNRYRISAVSLYFWNLLERRLEIRRRAKENKFISRFFRASRWRLLALKAKISMK